MGNHCFPQEKQEKWDPIAEMIERKHHPPTHQEVVEEQSHYVAGALLNYGPQTERALLEQYPPHFRPYIKEAIELLIREGYIKEQNGKLCCNGQAACLDYSWQDSLYSQRRRGEKQKPSAQLVNLMTAKPSQHVGADPL